MAVASFKMALNLFAFIHQNFFDWIFCSFSGSLTLEINGRITIVGIVSSGTVPSCEKGYVATFTRVSTQIQWIQENSDVSKTGCFSQQRQHTKYF